MSLGGAPHRRGCEGQRFVPANPFPAWVGLSFGARAPQRVRQSLRMVDELRRCASLGAERLTGRMTGIGVEVGEAPILDNRYGAAARDTEAAISMNAADAAAIGRHAAPTRRTPTGFII